MNKSAKDEQVRKRGLARLSMGERGQAPLPDLFYLSSLVLSILTCSIYSDLFYLFSLGILSLGSTVIERKRESRTNPGAPPLSFDKNFRSV